MKNTTKLEVYLEVVTEMYQLVGNFLLHFQLFDGLVEGVNFLVHSSEFFQSLEFAVLRSGLVGVGGAK